MSREAKLVLAIETTAPVPGAALARANGADACVIAEEHAKGSGRAEDLAACVRAVLGRAGVSAENLTALAVVDGPGSYTALRVGLALARGIAAVDRLPVTSCGSLELIAESCAGEEQMCTLLDASQGKVYVSAFRRERGQLREIREPSIVAVPDLAAMLEDWGGRWRLCGDAVLADTLKLDAVAPTARAGVLARVGAARVASGNLRAAEDILPRYLGATGARSPDNARPPAAGVR